MKLVSVSEMKAIEGQADASGLSYSQMMENAGRGLAELIHESGSGQRLGGSDRPRRPRQQRRRYARRPGAPGAWPAGGHAPIA